MSTRYGGPETALSRHETWKKGFNRIVMIMGVLTIITAISVGFAVWAVTSKPEPRYFAAREDGGILPIVPVKEPFLTDNQITNFATEAITRAMTMDFANWRRDQTDSSQYFTKPTGWEGYINAVNSNGMMEYIVTKRLTTTAFANRAVITQRGMNERGSYRWIVETDITVTYESASERQTENLTAQIEIVRVPTWETSRGVAINRISMSTGRG